MKDLYFYQTSIFHKRTVPFKNFFTYSYPSIMIKLGKLNLIKKNKFFSINSFNLLSFNTEDHGPRKKGENLILWVKNLIKKKFKYKNELQIYLFSIPRFLGYVFNPISIYLCFNNQKTLKFLIYQVKNTHHEQHCYVFKINKKNKKKQFANKKFYVSPFLKQDMRYEFNIKKILPNLEININAFSNNMKLLTGLKARQLEFSSINILKVILKNLFFAQKIMIWIHYESINIFRKSKKFFFKPEKKIDTLSYHE